MSVQTKKTDNSLNSILIVDDTPKNIQVLGSILKMEDFQVEFATNGEQALNWVDKKSFDLILLDVMMPVMSGFEVCEILRKDEALNDVPIIFLTARTDKESIIAGFDIGAQDYITKPFDAKELLARVRTHLELKESKEKLKSINVWLEDKVRDRTQELQISNQLLEDANKELLELDNQKADFLRLISHEIRTPLNGIIGVWDLLHEEAKSEDFHTLLDVMETSVERLEKFSKMALLITELRTRKIKLDLSVINLNSVIEEVLNEYAKKITLKNIRTIINLASDGIQVKCDRDLIKKCFENIIDNAVKYTPNEGAIHISANSKDGYINCLIKDEGPGISKDMMKNIFTLFTPDHHTDKNIGLGLPIIKLIMDTHQGNVKVYNSSDAGAIVELSFLI